ncbi:MAG: carbohydrate kinase family protein, partial [Streptosporangiaceae bacterium]
EQFLGGTGFNLAVALAQENVSAALAASIGRDDEGQALRSALESFGVTMLAQPGLPATRHAATHVSDGEPRYRFAEGTRRQVSLTPELVGAIRRASVVVVNSFPFDSTEDVRQLAAVFDSTAALRIIDPNPRPNLMGNPQLFAQNLRLLLASSDIVKISQADLTMLRQDLDQIVVGAVQVAFLTKGADGADIVSAGRNVYSAAATSVSPLADTIGAGDAALAGLIAAILRAEDESAGSAGGAPVRQRHALPSLDWRAHLAGAMKAAAACCREAGGPAHTPFGRARRQVPAPRHTPATPEALPADNG